MTFSLFRPCGNSLAGRNLTAFNLIYLPFWRKYFSTYWHFLTMSPYGFSCWVASVKLILANMSPVNTDELHWVPNHRMGHVCPTQMSVGEATSKLKGHGLWRHSLCRDTRPCVLSEWHMQQCSLFVSCPNSTDNAAALGHMPRLRPSTSPLSARRGNAW